MKNNYFATLIIFAFFAGTFLTVFTTDDSSLAAIRFISYLMLSCALAVFLAYKEEIQAYYQKKNHGSIDQALTNAEMFSKEYGDIYIMADKMKRLKKVNHKVSVSGKH